MVADDAVALADLDGTDLLAVYDGVLQHNVSLWKSGVVEGKELGIFIGRSGMERSDWNKEWPNFQ